MFEKAVKEEIVNTMVNVYDYTEVEANKFAALYHNRIEDDMWTKLDEVIEEIMEKKKCLD